MALIDQTMFGRPDTRVYKMLTGFQEKHAYRLNRYLRFWEFYKGIHWSKTRHPDDHFVTINYCSRIVDTHADFLMKDGFSIVIPDDPETPEYEDRDLDFISSALERVWRQNDKDSICIQMAQMAGITGDLFLRLSLDEDPIKGTYPKIEIIPSSYVYPTFMGPHGPAQNKLHSVLIAYPKFTESAGSMSLSRQFMENKQNYGEPRQYTEFHIERWFDDRVVYYDNEGRETVKPNPLGRIPVVHIKNYPISGEYYGRSDLSQIIPLQRELNEKATDISDVINYHGSPVTIVKGIKVSNLERGANRTWSIPEHASIENLSLNGELSASLNYFDRIRSTLFEVAGIPEQVISPTHQYQSATAGSLAYSSMLNLRKAKIRSFSAGLKVCNEMILSMLMMTDELFNARVKKMKVPISRLSNTEIVFPPALPRNESIELDRAEARLRMGISSRRREMELLGLSRSEIKRIEEERKADLLDAIESENIYGDTQIDTPDLGQSRVTPNPDVQGEKVSSRQDSSTETE